MAEMLIGKVITHPQSKFKALKIQAAKVGGALTSNEAVARMIKVHPSYVTQLFGPTTEHTGLDVSASLVGHLVRLVDAFCKDRVHCEIDWFLLDKDAFARRVAAGSAPDGGSADWERKEQNFLPSLVELRLYPPGPNGEVNAKLLFGTAICDYEPDDGEWPRAIAIALRDARLTIGSANCGPVEGTMLGEREETRDGEHFTRVAGGVEITGPLDSDILNGNPIGNHYLGLLEHPEKSREPFVAAVAAHRRSFVVADAEAVPHATTPLDNKDAILNVFIYRRCRNRDEENRAVLAQAEIRRISGGADRSS
jgi:hypothetical protein